MTLNVSLLYRHIGQAYFKFALSFLTYETGYTQW